MEDYQVTFEERDIPQGERDDASSSDFAGKGKSFPILKKEDVMAAVHSIGRAGSDNHSADTLKANIIRIAKRKGWGDALPDNWKSDSKESDTTVTSGVRLVESDIAFDSKFRFEEAAALNPLAKIISPGRGTTGYYSADVIKRDGPKIFKAGTLMYINHATPQEEAARPEGDWNKLAAVTVGPAYWDENGRDGPALYAPTKVFSDFAQQVKEKAPYTGLSIRAMGERDDKNKAPDGKPGIVTKLTHAESIDLVTKAGRGGKLLTEAATAIQQFSEGENPMDESRVLALIKEATGPLVVENSRLKSQLARIGAPTAIREALGTVRLPDASKDLIVNRLASAVPFNEAGEIDTAKLKTMVEAEALAEANYLKALGVGGVHGMGTAPTVEVTEAQRTEETKKMREHVDRIARNLFGVKTDAGAKVFAEGRAAFDPNYNTATKAGGILHGVALEG